MLNKILICFCFCLGKLPSLQHEQVVSLQDQPLTPTISTKAKKMLGRDSITQNKLIVLTSVQQKSSKRPIESIALDSFDN